MVITTKIVLLGVNTPSASSQIVPDNTLPTQVEQINNEYKITGGGTAGNNLFHSFREFSVPPGMKAFFNNAGNIENIFSRVTGNSISSIEGILKTNGMANFFLINPNGIIFGLDAQLDVAGSFLASTANSIKFADGTEFSSTNPLTPPILTVSVPIGLQFGNNSGSIVNRSVSVILKNADSKTDPVPIPVGLQVNSGKTLALIGGEIHLEKGNLTATEGRIELGSVANNSFVQLIPISQGWQLGYEGITDFQDIQLSNESIIDASGTGGTAQLQGRNITLNTGAQINLDTLGTESTGNLIINASQAVELLGESTSNEPSGFFTFVGEDVSGNGGNIIINTPRLSLRDGATVGLNTGGQGQGGQLTINATQLVEIVGVGVEGPSLLTTSTGGNADAGSIIINTERLVVTDGGAILAITTSEGSGGIITINASQSIEVSGSRPLLSEGIDFASVISATSGFEDLNSPAMGAGGNLDINTERLIISDEGRIAAGSFQGGEAGNLTINAGSIFLNQGRILAQSTSGTGGNIFINASDLLVLRNNSTISATAGTQQAGGNGGNIDITAPFIIAVPSENSDISADAFSGTGGNVKITETGIFGIAFRKQPTPLSDITASSQFGQAGTVTFNRPEVDPQTGIVTLPSEVVDAENIVVESCGARSALAGGEFVITGRGGIPVAPYEVPDLNAELADLGTSNVALPTPLDDNSTRQTSMVNSYKETIVEAQGWIIDTQGNIILTAESKVTPNSSALSSTRCQQSGVGS